MRAALDEFSESQSAEFAAQRLWCHHDQCAELVDGRGACEHGAFARHHQRAKSVALTGKAWCCELLTSERFARCADGVQRVGLGARAALASPRSIDLDDALTLSDQEARETGAVGASALDRPHAAAVRTTTCAGQHVAVAAARCGEVEFFEHAAGRVGDRR